MITGEYLAELAMDWSRGSRDRIRKLLESQGKQIEQNTGAWIVRSDSFTCGLVPNCSPVDALPQLLFALLGPMWPMVVGKAFDQAQKVISREMRRCRREEA